MNELSSLLVATVAQFKGICICSVCSDRTEVTSFFGGAHDSELGIDEGVARFATMLDDSFNTLLASPREHKERLTKY